MNIVIKNVEGKQRIQRLIEYLDLNFYDWSEQPNDGKPFVSGALPPAAANKVQQVINRAMLETELSEGEIIMYLEYWLKGKEIERLGGNDR